MRLGGAGGMQNVSLWLLGLSVLLCCVWCELRSDTTDAYALCDFYDRLPAAAKAMLTGWCGAKDSSGNYVDGPCRSEETLTSGQWNGVKCLTSGENAGRVFKLCLTTEVDSWCGARTLSGPLGGSLPNSMGNLTLLGQLYLAWNSLTGSIPSSFAKLSRLNILDLSVNGLSGRIPSFSSTAFTMGRLNLGNNHLSGGIPSSLGALSDMRFLYLNGNSLTGPIPSSLGNLIPNDLGLSSNALTGPVPPSFCNFPPPCMINVGGNPNLTCYPSCQSSNVNFLKDPSLIECAIGAFMLFHFQPRHVLGHEGPKRHMRS